MKNIIIEKLKRDISTITTEEWKIIASDDELYNIAHREMINLLRIDGDKIAILDKTPAEFIDRIFQEDDFLIEAIGYLSKDKRNWEDILILLFTETDYNIPKHVQENVQNYYMDFLKEILLSDIQIGVSPIKNYYSKIDNMKIIDFIIKNKLYNRANLIYVKNPNQEVVNFIIESLKHNKDLFILTYNNEIIDYCRKNNIATNIVCALLENNENEIIKELYDNDEIDLNKLKHYMGIIEPIIKDTDKYILYKVINDGRISEKEIERIKNSSFLKNSIKKFLQNIDYINYNLRDIIESVPELALFALRQNINMPNGKILLTLISSQHDLLLTIYKTYPEELKEAIKNTLNNNVNEKENIVSTLIREEYPQELIDVGLLSLNREELAHLFDNFIYYDNHKDMFIDFLNRYNIESLPFYYFKHNDFYLDSFDLVIRFFRGLTKEDCLYKLRIVSSYLIYNEEQNEQIKDILIDKLVKYKIASTFNEDLFKYVLDEKYIDKIFTKENPLKYDLYYYDIVYGKRLFTMFSVDELFDIINKENVSDFEFLLNNANPLTLELAERVASSGPISEPHIDHKQTLLKLKSLRRNFENNEEILKIIRKFIFRYKNISISEMVFFDIQNDLDIIQKIHFDCDEKYYTDAKKAKDYFKIEQTRVFKKLLHDKILERINNGKKVIIYLAYKCLTNKEIEDYINNENLLFEDCLPILKEILSSNTNQIIYGTKIISRLISCLTIDEINNNIYDDDTSYLYHDTKGEGLFEIFQKSENSEFLPYLLDKFEELDNNKELFSIDIFLLFNNPDIDKERLEKLINNILVDKRFIDFINLNNNYKYHPLFIQAIKSRIEDGVNIFDDNIMDYLLSISKNNELEDIIADIINNTSKMNSSFFTDRVINNPKIYKAIIRAIKEKRIDILWRKREIQFITFEMMKEYLIADENKIEYLLQSGNINEFNDEIIELLIKPICNYYKLNEENFRFFYQKYNREVFDYLEDEQFKEILNLDLETIKKIDRLIEPRELNTKIIDGVNYSLHQQIFASDPRNGNIINIFVIILNKISNGISDEEMKYYIELLKDYIPNDFLDSLNEYRSNIRILANNEEELDPIFKELDTIEALYKSNEYTELLKHLFNCLKTDLSAYSSVLRIITFNYVDEQRNAYGRKRNIYKDTKVKYKFVRKSLGDCFLEYLLEKDLEFLKEVLNLNNIDLYNPNIEIQNPDIFINNEQKRIDFYSIQVLLKHKLPENLESDFIKKINKNIGNIRKKIYIITEKALEDEEFRLPALDRALAIPDFVDKVKKEVVIPKRVSCYKELKKLNVQAIVNNVISNPKKYNLLLSIIEKYRIFEWGDIFTPSIKELGFGVEINDLVPFINSFNRIYDLEIRRLKKEYIDNANIIIAKMKKDGLPEDKITRIINEKAEEYAEEKIKTSINGFYILKYTINVSALPSCYQLILGPEDYDFVRRNPPNNSSVCQDVNKRLRRACQVYLRGFKMTKVSIPSFIEDVEIKNDKKIRVIVANRANPKNVSHGERTGACMRAYGYADGRGQGDDNDLFAFCSSNFNGFHITFMDPETNEYISRVSGYRNGNTVVLNELRNSLNISKYSDLDVVKAMQQIARRLIELTKDSELPIENVICSSDCALTGYKRINLDGDMRGKIYKGYKNVESPAVILATTGEDLEHPVEIKPSSTHPEYDCVRIPPIEYSSESISRNVLIEMQRIVGIKYCLEHEEDKLAFESLDIDFDELNKSYEYIIVGQDWFVALDIKGKVSYNIIPLDPRAKIEMDNALEKLRKIKEKNFTGDEKDGKVI